MFDQIQMGFITLQCFLVVGQNINDVHCELNCVSAVFSCVAFLQCYSMCFAKTVLATVMCTRVGFGFNVHCVVFWH